MTEHFRLNGWSIYWAVWLFGGFLAVELFNLIRGFPAGTLSDTVWAAENLNAAQPFDFAMWTDVHWAIAGLIWLLFAWLSLHLPFGLLR